MKKIILTIAAISLTSLVHANMDIPPHEGSENLQRMKAIEGTWIGKSVMHGEEVDVVVEYETSSNGSTVIETLHPGTPMEMVSVYYDEGEDISMTHYCSLGNQPHMALKTADESSIHLQMAGTSGLQDPAESHMHSLKITFIDSATIRHDWELFEGGEPSMTVTFELSKKTAD